ncbi:hypothetical protein ACEWY4_018436 [Coilia grayii]|uniref:ZP domain-containing protein n=1 Tax=Coilia grayii TaxID=363190 RepID=A0ABD1JGA4_9TELE
MLEGRHAGLMWLMLFLVPVSVRCPGSWGGPYKRDSPEEQPGAAGIGNAGNAVSVSCPGISLLSALMGMTWRLALELLCGLVVVCRAQVVTTRERCALDPTYGSPMNSDIRVTCATNMMYLSILLCPMYFSGYNESLMALNGHFQRECMGTADLAASPPLLKFQIDINEQAIMLCGNRLRTTSEPGTGIFADYSSVQYVNISGRVNSFDPTAGTITYKEEIIYLFSCQYPLQYFVNNTQLSVSGVSLAIKDNNGSFISTLSMKLYRDQEYTQALLIPEKGLQLKTRVFVEIKATNLTTRFNVLLDRCYASVSPVPTNSTYYDLFVGCNRDPQTVVHMNGITQKAQFSFEAFRFTEHKNKTISTFYLHCLTRLCENSSCASMMPVTLLHHHSYHGDRYRGNPWSCPTNRRRRDAASILTYRLRREAETTEVTEVATVSSGPIFTKVDSGENQSPAGFSGSGEADGDLIGVAVAAGVLSAACISMAVIITVLARRKMSR